MVNDVGNLMDQVAMGFRVRSLFRRLNQLITFFLDLG